MYLWEHADWPSLTWDEKALSPTLAEVTHQRGRLLGRLEALGFEVFEQTVLEALTSEAVATSEIEGENFAAKEVRSSIARRLGMDLGGLIPSSRHVDGLVEMMLDATRNHSLVVSPGRLFGWHAALFPTGFSQTQRVKVGEWRDDAEGPMQVVSGSFGNETIHYQAPPAERVDNEMRALLDWMNGQPPPNLLSAGLAHFWFVTIHPFSDGNGRIARALADLMLARSEATDRRFYSMSAQIRRERGDYYAVLEGTQKGGLDITGWQQWFLECLGRAIAHTHQSIDHTIERTQRWERLQQEPLNPRQAKVLRRLIDGFEGKLTTSKWAKLAKCSQDSAYRDILDLMGRGILVKNPGGGRSTSYALKE